MVEVAAAAPAAVRVALVAGATGLVGREVLAALSTDSRYSALHALGRRAAAEGPAKLTSHTVDFAHLPALPALDDVYIALGTTLKIAGSQRAFRAVDFDAVLAVAQAARTAGATRLGVVSAMGANPRSRVFYNRVKGEMEQAVAALGFATLVIARPSLLDGDRTTLGQRPRLAERIGLVLMRMVDPLVPADYRAIRAADVAHALIAEVHAGRNGRRVLLSGQMQAAAYK